MSDARVQQSDAAMRRTSLLESLGAIDRGGTGVVRAEPLGDRRQSRVGSADGADAAVLGVRHTTKCPKEPRPPASPTNVNTGWITNVRCPFERVYHRPAGRQLSRDVSHNRISCALGDAAGGPATRPGRRVWELDHAVRSRALVSYGASPDVAAPGCLVVARTEGLETAPFRLALDRAAERVAARDRALLIARGEPMDALR